MENTLLLQKILRVQYHFPLRSRQECEETLDIVDGDEDRAIKFLKHLGPRVPSDQGTSSTTSNRHKSCFTCNKNHVNIRIKPFDNCADSCLRDSAFTIKTAVRILLESRNMNKTRRCERQTVGFEQGNQV